jgi:hypothetical protein
MATKIATSKEPNLSYIKSAIVIPTSVHDRILKNTLKKRSDRMNERVEAHLLTTKAEISDKGR